MPTYEYECRECGHTFERFQSITAGALRKCPECSRFKLQRLIGSGSGIIFKGSGFYETDYKRKTPGRSSNGRTESSSSDAGGSSKDESKPKDASSGESEKDTAKKRD